MLVEIKGKKNEEVLMTTSLMVAEVFEKEHFHVLRDIEKLLSPESGLSEDFNKSNFGEITYTDSRNRKQKAYDMTRDGFTMLVMGYTGEKAMLFKERYIHAFNEMEKELKRLYEERKQWEIERAKGIMIRHVLTDTIKMKVAESPHKKFSYPNYTKLIYKTLFGKPFNELKNELGVKPKESVRDYLTSEQLREVETLEMLISGLISVGMGYEEIKNFITERTGKTSGGAAGFPGGKTSEKNVKKIAG